VEAAAVSVESCGYQVMSLDELIEKLQQTRAIYPRLATRPVWISNCPPLLWPVKHVSVRGDDEGEQMATHIQVERGGN